MRLNRSLKVVLAVAVAAVVVYALGYNPLYAAPFALGALTLEDAHLSFQKMYPDARSVPVAEVIRCFKKVHAEFLKNPQLQVVALSGLESADGVIADAPCKVFLIAVKKPSGSAVTAFFKVSDNASTAAADGDLATMKLTDTNWHTFFDPQGFPMGTGATAGSHTANNGNTKSAAADAPTGFAVIGAP